MKAWILRVFRPCFKEPPVFSKNDKGLVTIPFLLVSVIVLFFILSFFGLAMTLAHVSVSQYMSYSTARKLALSGKDQEGQRTLAAGHYKKLRGQFFAPSAHTGKTGDWFAISEELDPSSHIGELGGFDDQNHFRGMFYGAGLLFESRIAKFGIPFLTKGDRSPPFEARVMSFLGRESSQAECETFNKNRGQHIYDKYSSLPGFNVPAIEGTGDNGC